VLLSFKVIIDFLVKFTLGRKVSRPREVIFIGNLVKELLGDLNIKLLNYLLTSFPALGG